MDIPRELVGQFARGNGVVFVGTGLSQGAGLPGWADLMRELAAELDGCPLDADPRDIAQYYDIEYGRRLLVQKLRERLDALEALPTSVHEVLVRLSVSVIFTTNYDDLLERALHAAERPFSSVIGSADASFWSADRLQVVKLHGDLDQPESIVITTEDYERFATRRPTLSRLLATTLQTRTVLFLGYDATDPDLRLILTQVRDESGQFARNAYTVQFGVPRLAAKDLEQRGFEVIDLGETPDANAQNAILLNWLREFSRQVAAEAKALGRPSLVVEPRVAPFQVPRDAPWFVGREEELAELCEVLSPGTGQHACCLTGMGGIGKTALAIHAAHTLREYFTDGVLWANLATSEPLAILDSWAQAYDCDFSGLPDLASRAAALRGILADKKILVILDDARSAELMRPLLPGGPECTVLLTTRDMDLAVALDAYVYPLSALTSQESRQLMCRILGEDRVMAEADVADEICQLLGHLPLAVEIAAQRLANRRRWSLADLAERLRDETSRLEELEMSDEAVRASFAVSWDALGEDLRQFFSLLAVFEGRAFTASALAAVAEVDGRTAEDGLYALVALSLVAEEGEVHYRQHPLLTDFAREQLGPDEAAYARMAQYYLEYAAEHQHDYAALEREWDSLLAGMRVAYEGSMWPVVIDYTKDLADAWFARGHYTDARQGYEWACEAAQALGDRPALASGLLQWGRACIEQGDYDEAEERLSYSLRIYKELGDQRGVASVQLDLGWIAIEKANYHEAQELLAGSRHIREQLGDVSGVAEAIWVQAHIQFYYRNYEEAERLGTRALNMQQTINDRGGCLRTLRLLAHVAWYGMDAPDLAERYCQRALELCEELQEQGELAATLYTLSEVCRRQGDLKSARDHAEKGLALFRRMGDRKSQARAHYRLSLVDADLEDHASALQEGLQSLNLCRELQDAWGMVYALHHLGEVLKYLDQPDQAREKWSEALDIAEKLQHPLSEPLRECLGLDQATNKT